MIYTEKQLIELIQKKIGTDTVTNFAKRYGISRSSLSSAISGNRQLSSEIVKALGYEAVFVKRSKK